MLGGKEHPGAFSEVQGGGLSKQYKRGEVLVFLFSVLGTKHRQRKGCGMLVGRITERGSRARLNSMKTLLMVQGSDNDGNGENDDHGNDDNRSMTMGKECFGED